MDFALDRVDRRSLAIARVFAAMLFGLAAFIALPILLMLGVALLKGDPRGLAFAAVLTPIAWGLGWLGAVLWSGRPIPRWFMTGVGVFILAVPTVAVLIGGSWVESLVFFGIFLPVALMFWPALRGHQAKPNKGSFDELA